MNTLYVSLIYEFERGHRKGFFLSEKKRSKKAWFLRIVDVLIDMKKRKILYLDPAYYLKDPELKTKDTRYELLENMTEIFEEHKFFYDEGLYFAELMLNILSPMENGYMGEPNAILDYIERYIAPDEVIRHLKENGIDTSTIERVWEKTGRYAS